MADRRYVVIEGPLNSDEDPEFELTVWMPGAVPGVGEIISIHDDIATSRNGEWEAVGRRFQYNRTEYGGGRINEEWGVVVQVERHYDHES